VRSLDLLEGTFEKIHFQDLLCENTPQTAYLLANFADWDVTLAPESPAASSCRCQ
jgi:hypothetical protein